MIAYGRIFLFVVVKFSNKMLLRYVYVNSTSTDSELETWLHSFFMVSTITTS